jgi:predicted metal-dependent hydrolase
VLKNLGKKFLVRISGIETSVWIRTNVTAKRLILRVFRESGSGNKASLLVTVPSGVDYFEALRFVQEKEDWVMESLSNFLSSIKFENGAVVPYRGYDHNISHQPLARRGVWKLQNILYVSGREEFLARRLMDWFKNEARQKVITIAHAKAKVIFKDVGRISIRDTRSRWGSCGANGNLSFSWRLIMAPDFVLDYVVAHEVAHIREHNHGSRFWQLTDEMSLNMDEAKRWLRAEGQGLHRYG